MRYEMFFHFFGLVLSEYVSGRKPCSYMSCLHKVKCKRRKVTPSIVKKQ